MIIKRLTLKNFGVYAGSNTFLFKNEKPIVLIGGMNGRGKTTFLEAVLLALYGQNSSVYLESHQKSYSQYLRSFVNRNHPDQDCSVEMEFEINGEAAESYIIFREWNAKTKRTKETLKVYKDGNFDAFLTENWPMFVENILPSALSSFFFFDGEKIAELAIDSSNVQLKNAIRSMLGISVLDVLNNDLVRNLRKIEKNNNISNSAAEAQRLREVKENAVEELNTVISEIDGLQRKTVKDEAALDSLFELYTAKGGIAMEQRQELLQQKAIYKTENENITDKLFELAAAELPLSLVSDLIQNIKLEATDEHMEAVLSQSMPWIDNYYNEFNDLLGDESGSAKAFLDFVKDNLSTFQNNPLYDLSDQALFQVNSLVESVIQETVNEAESLLRNKSMVTMKINELEGYLSLDINENELQEIQEKIRIAEKVLIDDQIKATEFNQLRSDLNYKTFSATQEFNKYVESYLSDAEQMDTIERTIKYSNIAMNIIEKYKIELQKRKTSILSDTITDCYRKLANKKNMISKIIMDPYSLDLIYYSADGDEVPRESLSAGEKQLMVVSILWALAICSKKKLPTIIDTPLSRLDSMHRNALITTYFPNAGEQTIILSTDSEIDAEYYELMKENVGDEFTLKYDEETKSTSIEEGYLTGNKNDY